jgi:hypothetical protein
MVRVLMKNQQLLAIDSPLVQQVLAVLLAQRGELRRQQNELDGVKEVGLSRAVAPDDHIVVWAKRRE